MKRNRFKLVLVPAVSTALLAFGCDRPRPTQNLVDGSRVCIDADGKRVADDQCRDDLPTNRSPTFYHWYHVSHGGSFVPIGGFVSGHAFSHGSTSHPSSVTRGGFGSSAKSHGAGS